MTKIFVVYDTIGGLASELREIAKTHRIVQVVNDRRDDDKLATWWIVIAETTEVKGGEA